MYCVFPIVLLRGFQFLVLISHRSIERTNYLVFYSHFHVHLVFFIVNIERISYLGHLFWASGDPTPIISLYLPIWERLFFFVL